MTQLPTPQRKWNWTVPHVYCTSHSSWVMASAQVCVNWWIQAILLSHRKSHVVLLPVCSGSGWAWTNAAGDSREGRSPPSTLKHPRRVYLSPGKRLFSLRIKAQPGDRLCVGLGSFPWRTEDELDIGKGLANLGEDGWEGWCRQMPQCVKTWDETQHSQNGLSLGSRKEQVADS